MPSQSSRTSYWIGAFVVFLATFCFATKGRVGPIFAIGLAAPLFFTKRSAPHIVALRWSMFF